MTVSNTCYLPFIPPDPAKVDATGHIQGSDLRGTSTYERFVDSLSKHPDPAVQASPARREQARAAVDAMKIKSGMTLVVPCREGQNDAPLPVSSATAQAQRAGEPQALSDTPVAIGFWHHAIHWGKQLFASLTDRNTIEQAEIQANILNYDQHMRATAYASAM